MPFGEFQYSVDDKGRVIIPPSFREFVNDGMVITRGLAETDQRTLVVGQDA